jgi:hypothetical protein
MAQTGRPSMYTDELAKDICDKIASHTCSVGELCKLNPHWPKVETIRVWRRSRSEFAAMYAQAKIDQIEGLVDEIIEISDNQHRDTITDDEGNERCNSEWIARSRLRVDSRKWLASKLVPKLYGMSKIEVGAEGSLLEKIINKL